VYATCSLHPEENEIVVNHLLTKFPEATIEIPAVPGLKNHPGLVHWEGTDLDESLRHCLRIYPHDNDTDGFFIAAIRRNAN
jgi:16S rRNA C967 or C1407 C5-methylase (RsmB/RsmF family)